MTNRYQPLNNVPEHNDPPVQHLEVEARQANMVEEQLLMNHLLEGGFALEEANRLVYLREHLCENGEMQQRMADDCRMHFARWLYENGEMRE